MTSKSGGQGPTRPAPAHWARGRCDFTAVFFLPGLRTESVLLQASTDELRQPGLAQAEGGGGAAGYLTVLRGASLPGDGSQHSRLRKLGPAGASRQPQCWRDTEHTVYVECFCEVIC